MVCPNLGARANIQVRIYRKDNRVSRGTVHRAPIVIPKKPKGRVPRALPVGIYGARRVVKEVQDTSCQGFGGVPQINKSPKSGGLRGLINTIL